MLGDEGQRERCHRLHRQVRSPDAADDMAVAQGAEQCERHRPARNGEQTIRHSEHHHEARGGSYREPEQRQQREGHEQHGNCKARNHERMDAARKQELADACRHLRRPEQCADRHHRRGIDAGAAEDREQMRGQARRHEGIGRERGRQQDERPSLRIEHGDGRHRRRSLGSDGGRGARARQCERVQRGGDDGKQSGVDEIGAAPADRLEQHVGHRPAHRRGKASGQGQHRDRAPGSRAEDAAERGKGGIVEARRDGHAQQHPDRKVGDRMRGIDEQGQAEGAEQRADRHDAMSTEAVDQEPDARRSEPRREQRERKAAHREGHRPAALGCDQRHRQDRRIEDRTPGEDLRDAEHQDGAPGAGNDIAKVGHRSRRDGALRSFALS